MEHQAIQNKIIQVLEGRFPPEEETTLTIRDSRGQTWRVIIRVTRRQYPDLSIGDCNFLINTKERTIHVYPPATYGQSQEHGIIAEAVKRAEKLRIDALIGGIYPRRGTFIPKESGYPVVTVSYTPDIHFFTRTQDERAAYYAEIARRTQNLPNKDEVFLLLVALGASAPDILARTAVLFPNFYVWKGEGVGLSMTDFAVSVLRAYGHTGWLARVRQSEYDVTAPGLATYIVRTISSHPVLRYEAEKLLKENRVTELPLDEEELKEIAEALAGVRSNLPDYTKRKEFSMHDKSPFSAEDREVLMRALGMLIGASQRGLYIDPTIIGDSFPKGCPNLGRLIYSLLSPATRKSAVRKFREEFPGILFEITTTTTSRLTAEEARKQYEHGTLSDEELAKRVYNALQPNGGVVLDASGSMDPAVEALRYIVKMMGRIGSFRFPVVVVSENVWVMDSSTFAFRGVRAEGRTPLIQGIAVARLLKLNPVIVLTDWAHNVRRCKVTIPLEIWRSRVEALSKPPEEMEDSTVTWEEGVFVNVYFGTERWHNDVILGEATWRVDINATGRKPHEIFVDIGNNLSVIMLEQATVSYTISKEKVQIQISLPV